MAPHGDLVALGQAVRRAREKKGLSQARLAEATDINDRTIMYIELGRHGASVERLFRIAAVLEVPLSRLIAEAEIDPDDPAAL